MDGKFGCSKIFELDGVKIGVIGYTTEETPDISDTGALIFNEVVNVVKNEADRLRKDEKCQILIGVGHYGYKQVRNGDTQNRRTNQLAVIGKQLKQTFLNDSQKIYQT